MRFKTFVVLIAIIAVFMLPGCLFAASSVAPADSGRAVAHITPTMPLSFEPTAVGDRYLARSGRYSMLIGPSESSVAVTGKKSGSGRVFRFAFDNANPAASMQTLDPLPGVTNYYIGKPENWRLGVKNFAKVRTKQVYPGIDVVYYGDQRQLEFDFVVAPNADPKPIALNFSGTDKLYTEAGDLVAELGGELVRFAKPFAYQMVDGKRAPVTVEYALDKSKAQLRLGNYDKNRELVIDPILSYSTYIAGSMADTANAMTIDSANNVYITGETCSGGMDPGGVPFPAPNPNGTGTTFDGECDAYISKIGFNAGTNVTTLLFTTFIGGSNGPNKTTTVGNGIALDLEPNTYATQYAYVIGTTNYWGVPLTFPNPATYDDNTPKTAKYNGGDHDAFITLINTADGQIYISTYLGGTDDDQGYAITVDSQRNVTAVGQTKSFDFPMYNGFQPKTETYVAFATKLDFGLHIAPRVAPGASGISPRRWSNTETDCTTGALCPPVPDPAQNFYFFSSIFGGQLVPPASTWPCSGTGANMRCGGGYPVWTDGFSCLVNPSPFVVPDGAITIGTPQCSGKERPPLVLVAETGESGAATVTSMGLLWGSCSTLDVNAHVMDCGGFTWRILGPPLGPVYATTEAYGVGLDPNGDVFAVGGSNTASLEPANYAWLPGMHYAGTGAWIIKLRGNDGWPVYLTPLGTNPSNMAQTVNVAKGVAVDSQGRAYIVGTADGGIYTQATSAHSDILGGTDAFALRMNPSGSGIEYGTYFGGKGNDQGLGIAIDVGGTAFITGSTGSSDLPLINPLLDANSNTLGQLRGVQDAFVARLNADGSALTMSAYLGGSGADQGNAIVVDQGGSGDIFVAGDTNSVDFPLRYPLSGQEVAKGGGDAWTARILGTSFPSVSVSPSSLNFGSQVVGFSSPTTQAVTIRSTGQAFLKINSITADGDFTQANNCPTQLTPAGGTNDTCTVTITFTPTQLGTRSGTLTINDDAPNTPQAVGLMGQGVTVSATVSPSSLTFGSINLGSTSAAQSVTVTNTDSAQNLIMNTPVISTNGGGTDFAISANGCQTIVTPGRNCTYSVTFTPSLAGSRSGTLVINGNGSAFPATVQLAGTGNGGGTTPDTGQLITASTASVSGAAGGSASFTVAMAQGHTQPVALTCSSANAGITCTITPSTITTATPTATVSLAIAGSVTGPKTATLRFDRSILFATLLPFGLVGFVVIRKRRLTGIVLALLLLAAIMFSVGCSNTSKSVSGGSYQIAVTGTSAGATQTVHVTLNVY